MVRRDVSLNSSGMRKLLLSDQIRPPLREVAERIASEARRTAPVDTGAYRDGIDVEDATTDRAVARVVSRDRKTPIVEAKTGNLKRAMGKA